MYWRYEHLSFMIRVLIIIFTKIITGHNIIIRYSFPSLSSMWSYWFPNWSSLFAASKMLRRRIPQSGHLMTAKKFWLQTIPSEVIWWRSWLWLSRRWVWWLFLLRIATLCLPSPQTQRSQLLSGWKRGFIGFRQRININIDLRQNINYESHSNIQQELTLVTRSLNFSQQRGKLVSCIPSVGMVSYFPY